MLFRGIFTVIITSAFLTVSALQCADKLALGKINAWTHQRVFESGRSHEDINFNLLDTYATIDVTKANVTHLCEGMIKNFPRLQSLSLINVNLSRIDPGAFQKLPKLMELSLSVNKLTEINREVFQGLQMLTNLYLSSNQISVIEAGAFSNMPHLKSVHLDRNKLTEINGNLFDGSPRIRHLDFSLNAIERVASYAFNDIRPDISEIRSVTIKLSGNGIFDFAPDSLEQLPVVQLHLERNRLTSFEAIFHTVQENSQLYLNHNQITCIPDDVLDFMKNTTISVYVLDNPFDCSCLNNIRDSLAYEIYGTGQLVYNETCNTVPFF